MKKNVSATFQVLFRMSQQHTFNHPQHTKIYQRYQFIPDLEIKT